MSRQPFDIATSRIPLLPAKKLHAGVRELEWCREELANFDVMSVHERGDPRIDALEAAIEEAVLSLFEKDSPEWARFRRDGLVDNACFSLAYPTPIHEVRQGLRAGMDDQLMRLDEAIFALKEGLDVLGEKEAPPMANPWPDAPTAAPPLDAAPAVEPAPAAIEPTGIGVAVVHSRDDSAGLAVTEFLAQLGLTPMPSTSSATTLDQLQGAGFAVILAAPDDIRTLNDPQTSPDFKPSATQEVVFKLGFLVGALGPQRVCALLLDDIQLPIDQFGIRATPMDPAEGWKLDIAKMVKAAGIPIDLNRAI